MSKLKNLINAEFRDALLRKNIHAFTQRVFQHINPGIRYHSNWHIDLIMEQLEEVRRGNIKRLIINMPPRSLKSVCASVAFPAWVLAHQPHKRVITASYSLQLAKKHSLDCRGVVTSDWYQKLFPNTQITREQNDKLKFQTTDFGFRLATSVGGTLTGEGGDIIILDDPINASQAQSPQLRDKVNEWYQQTLVSRLDDKTTGAIVLVMQRFHPEDLSGYLLKSGGWQHLCLPLVEREKKTYNVCGKKMTRNAGELLHKKRDTKQYAEQLKSEIGAYAFEAQYQQNPLLPHGNMVKARWFKTYDEAPQNGLVIQSWDTAIKSQEGSDYSVCVTVKLSDGVSYILDISQQRMEYPVLKKHVKQLAESFTPDHILIEDKASGQQLIQDLKSECSMPIISILPKGDKFSRISAATGMIEAGKVALPKRAKWLGEFMQEVLAYPNVKHDDQIDALSQYLNWLRRKPKDKLNIRSL